MLTHPIASNESEIKSEEKKPLIEYKDVIDTPRTYSLAINTSDEKPETDKITFYVLGCAGNSEGAQKQVALLMNKVAAEKVKPKFIILLGDNFYNKGLDSATSTAFDDNFYNIYHHSDVSTISGIPFFVILGNHDHNLHYFWKKGGGADYEKAGAQVMRTYVENNKISAEKITSYQKPTLDLANLPTWNMPSRFYILRFDNVELFFIDSNTYVKDYLASLNDLENASNQANWLQAEFHKNPDKQKLLFLHHPLFTIGKRAYYATNSFDSGSYLSADEILAVQNMKMEGCYNVILRQVLEKQRLHFDTVFAAHDHSIYYYNNQDNHCQIVAGGGGGERQYRMSFQDFGNVPAFINDYGFVSVEINTFVKKPLLFNFYGVEGMHLQFAQNSNTPMRCEVVDEQGVTLLKDTVIPAYTEYFNFLKSRQDDCPAPGKFLDWGWGGNLKHGVKGVERADNLRNFFNAYATITFQQACNFLHKSFEDIGRESEHSLITLLRKELTDRHELTWEQFTTNPSWILIPKSDRPEDQKSEDTQAPSSKRYSYSLSLLNTSFFNKVTEVLQRTPTPPQEAQTPTL